MIDLYGIVSPDITSFLVASHSFAFFPMSGFHPKILEKYKIRREIGRGAYGVVSSAKEIKTERGVAIKQVGARNFDETILTKRALRELKILRHLNGHENVFEILIRLLCFWTAI
jgi:serine/threonine protein kinase